MSTGLKILRYAVEVFVTCILISLIVYGVSRAQAISKSQGDSLNGLKQEITSSDLTTYEGTTLKGITVISAIKKFQRSVDVKVITVGGTRIYNTSSLFTNTNEDSIYYVDPDGSFTCTDTMNANGIIGEIIFKQKDAVVVNETVTNIDDAKQLIVSALGIGSGDSESWQSLANKVSEEVGSSYKTTLANKLGAGYSNTDSWSTLASAAGTKIQDLTNELASINGSTSSAAKTLTVHTTGDNVLDFKPSVIIATGADTGLTYFYYADAWAGNDGPITADLPLTLVNRNNLWCLDDNKDEEFSITYYK